MRFGILGPTELHDGETAVPLGAAKQRGLLALLLLRVGRPVPVDTLIDHLWPGTGDDDHRKIIYSMVSRLRALLGRSGVRHDLSRVGGAYRLDVDPLSVDVHEFRTLVDRSRAAIAGDRPAEAVAGLQRAVGLWRGEPLADLRGPAADHLRRPLTDALLDAHKLLADGRLRIGQHDAALLQVEALVQEYDLDESLARLWVTALCAAGRQDDARRYLAVFRKRFRRELRAEPRIDLDAILAGAPRSAAGRPHQLPYTVRGFVGRADLLAELDRLAEPGPDRSDVVVITGMPGIGKTTLAIHWAQSHLDLFPDGQLYLDAGAFGPGDPVDPQEALGRFLYALGVPPDRIPEDVDGRRQRFNDLLHGRRVLVVLDNVVDSAHARPLIPAPATCLTVITSRHRLSGLTIREGVRTLVSGPLPDPEAAALLARNIGAGRTAAEPDAVHRLAAIAGGLPLALRILGEEIAGRPRSRLADLARELQEHLLWTSAEGDGLTSVFGWSYRSLPADAAALFRRLSLHPGSRISLDAAAALAGADRRGVERLLDQLARANLIEHDIARHYRLHDLLRRYAGSRAAAEDGPAEIDRCRRAVVTWYLRSAARAAAILIPQLPSVPDLPPPDPYEMDFPDEATALAWCLSQRENLAAAAACAAGHGMHRLAWQIPAAIHNVFTRTGRYDDLIRLNEAGAESARRDGHVFGEFANLNNLGYAFCATHQYDRAIVTLTAARARAAEAGDIAAESVCAHNLGAAHLGIGETAKAVEMFHELITVSRKLGNTYGESATLHRLADAYRRTGEPDLALTAYTSALTLRQQLGAVREQAQTHQELSRLFLEKKDLGLAALHCTAAHALVDRIADAGGRCDALITKADIERLLGSASAVDRAREAVSACVALEDSYRRVHALAVLADALAAAAARDEAARVRTEALRIAADLSGPDALPLIRRLLVP